MANETAGKESETTVTDVDPNDQGGARSYLTDAFMSPFTSSALGFGLVLVGTFPLLAALGQLSGIDILGETA